MPPANPSGTAIPTCSPSTSAPRRSRKARARSPRSSKSTAGMSPRRGSAPSRRRRWWRPSKPRPGRERHTLLRSSPRKRGSRASDRGLWIPAFAGMNGICCEAECQGGVRETAPPWYGRLRFWPGVRNVENIADRLIRGADHAVQQGRLGRLRRVSELAEIPRTARHGCGADHGFDRRDLDARARGKKANHRRDGEDEDAAHADLLWLYRKQYRVDDRQRPFRRGERRRRRDARSTCLYLRAGKRHRAIFPRGG